MHRFGVERAYRRYKCISNDNTCSLCGVNCLIDGIFRNFHAHLLFMYFETGNRDFAGHCIPGI